MRFQMAARRCRVHECDGVFQTLLRRSTAGPSPAFPLDLAATQYCEDECPLPGQSLAICSRSAARRRRISLDDISGRSLGIQPRSAARRRCDAYPNFSVCSLGIQPTLAAIQCRADDEDVSGLSLGIQPRLAASRRRVDDECISSRSLGIQPRLAANRCRSPRCSVTTRFPLIHLLDWLVCWALWLSRHSGLI